jgi:uncharacterized protein YkwD
MEGLAVSILRAADDRADRARSPMQRLAFPSAMLAVALVLVGCGGAAAPIVPPGGAGTPAASSVGEEDWALEVLDLTNKVRAANGLGPLVLDAKASAAAYDHCWDMDVRGFFDHENPDGEGPKERLARHGIDTPWVGENLARGHATPVPPAPRGRLD